MRCTDLNVDTKEDNVNMVTMQPAKFERLFDKINDKSIIQESDISRDDVLAAEMSPWLLTDSELAQTKCS